MTKRFIFITIIFLNSCVWALPHAWINEIHYDNAGTDRNEFVEVVVEHPENWYLDDLCLYMYNGYDGVQYCLDTIEEFEPGQRIGDFQFYTWYQRGIQNDTEGMILVFRDTLVDILAYEGSFTGNNEPADGVLFPDIGVAETGSGPDTCSIYLTGIPSSAWEYGTATPGALNSGQELSDLPSPLVLKKCSACYREHSVHIQWTTASEAETGGYRISRNGEHIAYIEGQGYSTSPTDYEFIDTHVMENCVYTYTLEEIHFSGKAIKLHTLTILPTCPRDFGLGSIFPNPANPESVIELDIFKTTDIHITLLDLKGRKVKALSPMMMNKGTHRIPLNMRDFPSGKYIVQCRSNSQVESFELTLLK